MPKRFWASYLIVFVASACTLILEIVAARILAPYVGVSIYTWTTIIGVVLAGISLGNYTGGLLADRAASRLTLGIILALGGLSSLSVLPLIELITAYSYPPGFGLLAQIVVMTTAIFLPPAFILGMVSPIVIKLTLQDLAQTGSVAGRIYAFSTLGAILGTFLTGFVLISMFGTRTIVLVVGLTLIAMALLFGGFHRAWKPGLAVLVVTAGLLYSSTAVDALDSGCTRETDFYCVKVWWFEEGGRTIHELVLDHLIHSYSDLDDPTYLHYGYMRVYAELTDYVAQQRPDFKAMHIGGGGYTMPRYIEVVYPDASDLVIEIDAGVTEIAYQYMGLPADTSVETINHDARMVIAEMDKVQTYDLVYGDAFNDLSVPYHLTTHEFVQDLAAVMKEDGLYLLNVIDKLHGGRFLPSMVRTLQTVFSHVYIMSDGASWTSDWPSTYVVVASAAALDTERLRSVHGQGFGGRTITNIMPAERMEEWLASADSVLLTDEYAPVDNLLAPLFLERG